MARVLCLHGLGGTGRTMWPLVAALSGAGHAAFAPTLPGHGSVAEDLLGVRWEDWLASALEWPADVVVGQSMGAALALAVAAAGRCTAVVAINPPASDPDALEGLAWRRERGHEWVDVPVHAGESGYERLPLHALEQMTRGVLALDLGAVTQPVLLVTSTHDEVIDPASSDEIAGRLGGTVHRVRLPRSGHVATLDGNRDVLATAVVTFVDLELSRAASRPRPRS